MPALTPRRLISHRFEYPAEQRPPIGAALSQELAADCNLSERFPSEDPSNLQRVALFYEIARSRRQLVDAVTDAVQTGKRPSPMLRALAELGFPLVITTNYDRLFESALIAGGKQPRVAVYKPNPRGHGRLPRPDGGEPCRVQDPRRHPGVRRRSSSPTRITSSSFCGCPTRNRMTRFP